MLNSVNVAKLAFAGCTLRGMYIGAVGSRDDSPFGRGVMVIGWGIFGCITTPIEIAGRIVEFIDPPKRY